MKIDKDTQKKIQELQLIEQNLQNLLLQKQAFQLELNETTNAFEEIKKTKGDVFRVLGQIMLKSDRNVLEKELKEKKDILNLRINSIEKQENNFRNSLERLKGEIIGKIDA